jgi:hypothetical protein
MVAYGSNSPLYTKPYLRVRGASLNPALLTRLVARALTHTEGVSLPVQWSYWCARQQTFHSHLRESFKTGPSA